MFLCPETKRPSETPAVMSGSLTNDHINMPPSLLSWNQKNKKAKGGKKKRKMYWISFKTPKTPLEVPIPELAPIAEYKQT